MHVGLMTTCGICVMQLWFLWCVPMIEIYVLALSALFVVHPSKRGCNVGRTLDWIDVLSDGRTIDLASLDTHTSYYLIVQRMGIRSLLERLVLTNLTQPTH